MNKLIDNGTVNEVLRPKVIPERGKAFWIFWSTMGMVGIIAGLINQNHGMVKMCLIFSLFPLIFLLFRVFAYFTWSVIICDKKLIINDYLFRFYLVYERHQEILLEDIDCIYYLEKEYNLLRNYRHKLRKYHIPAKELDYRKENLINNYNVPDEVITMFEHSSQKVLNDYRATGVLMALENILDKYPIPSKEKKKIIKHLKKTPNFDFEQVQGLLSPYSIIPEDISILHDEFSNGDVANVTPFLLTKLKVARVERSENQGRGIGFITSVSNTMVFSNRDGTKKVYFRHFHSLSRANWQKLIHIINQHKSNVNYLMTGQYYRNISDPNFKPGCG